MNILHKNNFVRPSVRLITLMAMKIADINFLAFRLLYINFASYACCYLCLQGKLFFIKLLLKNNTDMKTIPYKIRI